MTATRSFIIAAVLAVLAIAAAVYFFARPGSEPVKPAPVETAADNSETSSDSSDVPSLLAPPVFDIVRVAPAGTAVIAGRGEPEAEISILANGDEIARETVNERGEWVVVLTEPLPAGSIEVGLMMYTADGRELRSEQVVVQDTGGRLRLLCSVCCASAVACKLGVLMSNRLTTAVQSGRAC